MPGDIIKGLRQCICYLLFRWGILGSTNDNRKSTYNDFFFLNFIIENKLQGESSLEKLKHVLVELKLFLN